MKEVGSGGWGRERWDREEELWLLTSGGLRGSWPTAILVSWFWLRRDGPAPLGWSLTGVSRYLLRTASLPEAKLAQTQPCVTFWSDHNSGSLSLHWRQLGQTLISFCFLSEWEQKRKFSERWMFSADKGSFSNQLGWKSPGNINERSHFRWDVSHPLLPT